MGTQTLGDYVAADAIRKAREREVLDGLIHWLDARGDASNVCAWGEGKTYTFRWLIEKYRRERTE